MCLLQCRGVGERITVQDYDIRQLARLYASYLVFPAWRLSSRQGTRLDCVHFRHACVAHELHFLRVGARCYGAGDNLNACSHSSSERRPVGSDKNTVRSDPTLAAFELRIRLSAMRTLCGVEVGPRCTIRSASDWFR